MEEEEASLRKQLEDAEGFDERREIRQKLRELRKKKLAALETDTPTTTDRDKRRAERRRQRERENEENSGTSEIKTEEKTAVDIVSNEGDENSTITKSFQFSVSTTQSVVVENGTENGSTEEEVPEEADGETKENGATEDEPLEAETEQLVETVEKSINSKSNKGLTENGEEKAGKQNETAKESSLAVIEEIEDVDNLERLLKDIPLSEFELRKKIRSRIRMIKAKQEQNAREGTSSGKSAAEDPATSEHLVLEESSPAETLPEGEPSPQMSRMMNVSWSREEQFGEKKHNRESMDDTSSTLSSQTTSSDVTSDCASDVDLSSVTQASDQQMNVTSKGTPSLLGSSSAAEHSKKNKTSKVQQMDFRGQLQKRSEDPTANPSRAPGRKKVGGPTQMDFRGLLKSTGGSTKQNPFSAAKIDKLRSKAGGDQVDFRSVLTKDKSVSAFGKKLQGKSELPPEEVKPVSLPPKRVQDFKRREESASSTTESKEQAEGKTEEKKEPQRKVSSSDLFNLLHQPKEGSDYLKQRGLKKGDTQKPCEQKFTTAHHHPKESSGDEELKSQLAWRKNKSDHFFKPVDPRNERSKWKQREPETVFQKKTKLLENEASTEEGSDLTERKPDSPSQASPLETPGEAEEDLSQEEPDNDPDKDSSTANMVQVELNVNGQPETPDPESVEVEVVLPLVQPAEECIDLPETPNSKTAKLEDRKERDNVDGKKEDKKTVEVSDKGKAVARTTVEKKTVKPEEGTAITLDKKTEISVGVSGKDGGKKEVTTKVEEKKEVHKSDGATVTLTKTTKTTEVQTKGAPSRGGAAISIDARLKQMRKDRAIAKKQAAASTRDKRNAFKQQLESQSSSKGPVKRTFSAKSNVTLLLEWCRRRTAYHEGVEVTNFTTSWADGLAFCALLHYFVPNKIDYDSLKPGDKKSNWSLGFRVAGEEGIEPLLELEDVMCVDIPEPKSLITYIHFVYQHFMEKQQKEKAIAGQ